MQSTVVIKSSPGMVRSLLSATLLSFGAMSFVAETQAQTVNAVMHSGVRIIDPILTTAHITRNHGYMVFDTLLGMN